MESSLKNIVSILAIATCAFLGYYIFVQKDINTLALDGGAVTAELFVDVQKYIERRAVLDAIAMDTSIFSDERFRSLVGYPTDIVEQPVGRTNPFDEAESSGQGF
jgi:hypothetical protein